MAAVTAPTEPVPVPPSLLSVAGRVEVRLESILTSERGRWGALSADLTEPLDSLRSLVMSGGKRLRPAFCYWGYIGAGGTDDEADGIEAVIDAGAAFEFLQAFALVHDDIMDGSAIRRGSRTAHLAFGDRHAQSAWRGDGRRFGEGVAILIGDLAHVYADLMLEGAPDTVVQVWNELRIELNIGQYLDILGTARGDTDQLAARRISRYKSGKYTIERPLHVGAAHAGRLDDLRASLSAYGDPLGEVFQLRDDLLGVFGQPDQTGKPVGDDLREGKPTPLLALTTQRADQRQAASLERVGALDLTETEIRDLQAVMIDTGAVAEIESLIEDLTGEAISAIEVADVTDEARRALVELAYFVAWRKV